jgi:nucleoid DNA-binding protein
MKLCKAPDVKAPRYRTSQKTLINNELLNKVKEKTNLAHDLDYRAFERIIKTFNKKIADEVIHNRNGVELMNGLGRIFVGTCKSPKKKNIDIPQSIKIGVIVHHKNWETDGHLAKIFYSNSSNKYKFKHNQVWKYTPGRILKRELSPYYKDNWEKYIKVESDKQINQQIKQNIRIDKIKKRIEHGLNIEYNEFEM